MLGLQCIGQPNAHKDYRQRCIGVQFELPKS
jgi:hypothetical protein